MITQTSKPKYQYNCTNPDNESELTYIIEHMTNITLQEFESNVDTSDFTRLKQNLGYTKEFTIDKDWHVRYAKAQSKNKKPVYILIHSCIEYIFY